MRNNNKSLFEKKVEEISLILNKKYKTGEIGLYGGNAGVSLFLMLYTQTTNKNNKQAVQLLENCIDLINRGSNFHTFCTGISGFLWTLNYLGKNDFINKKDIENLFTDTNIFLYNRMNKDIETGNFDFLHGATGVAYYFSDRIEDNTSIHAYLKSYIDELEKACIIEEDGSIKWLSIIDYKTGEKGFNFSMSHGMASIIALLSKFYKKDICKEKSLFLLNGVIKYLLKNKNDVSKLNCYFPNYINKNSNKSRLAWCYGDLGIAVALYNAAKTLNDSSLEDFALEVLLYSTKRKGLENESVIDAGLCHGSAGIAHIYNRMFWNTKNIEFKNAAEFWFNETIKMAKFDDGLAGYKAYLGIDDGWQNAFGLLEGIAGIGIALDSWTTQKEPKWDECLLLS
jgi:lantibiotic biosynthesis protein